MCLGVCVCVCVSLFGRMFVQQEGEKSCYSLHNNENMMILHYASYYPESGDEGGQSNNTNHRTTLTTAHDINVM